MLATTWVTRPAVCDQISGPVVASCASGLCLLAYWLGMNAPGVLSTSRRATE
jgi:hypothetical protein